MPFFTFSNKLACVAATTRTSTFTTFMPPTRSSSPSCNTRNNLACAEYDKSPISSKNNVPPFARSNRPSRDWCAPVYAPLSTPKSSASNKSSGMAAQFTAINGCSFLSLLRCNERANNSLPTPVSPNNRTVTGPCTALPNKANASLIAFDVPITLQFDSSWSISDVRSVTTSSRKSRI